MGLLDDAIRDHLDLKRRRGADPAEIERAEREALGPVRRTPAIAPLPDEEPMPIDSADRHQNVWDEAPGDEPAGRPVQKRRGFLRRRSAAEPELDLHQIEPGAYGLGDELEDHFDPGADELLLGEPAPAPDPLMEQAADEQLGETVEYDVEGSFGEHKQDEDVLEETPEFLQDTPDHDRLWFEQRPPRDFDFDE